MCYVDAAIWQYKRMTMCHMLADTREELIAMAERIGVARRHIQEKPVTHFDICKSKRALAVAYGAREVSRHELVTIIKRLKKADARQGVTKC